MRLKQYVMLLYSFWIAFFWECSTGFTANCTCSYLPMFTIYELLLMKGVASKKQLRFTTGLLVYE